MQYYLEPKETVLKTLNSTLSGLNEKQVAEKKSVSGPNKLEESKKESLFKKILNQLLDPMLVVLLFAAAISTVVSIYANESFADTIIILFVIVINTLLGVYQESKAEKAIEALNNMTKATTKVIRDGKLLTIESENLVPGDIISLEAGDMVPADVRILESLDLKVEEAALTGESIPVEKISEKLTSTDENIPLGDRKNMAYMGSTAVYGRATAVVTDIGLAAGRRAEIEDLVSR